MERVMPLFNQLQEILYKASLNESLQLPQIVAIGGQSTGKSSVLESILGKDILPRGSGIVTRRPIILQLNNTAPGSEEYIEFSHRKHEKFTDWHQARREIEQEMNKVAGENKGISSEPIIVSMFSPHILNLNIVDLPGVTKIPVGDQPPDIEQRIHEMIRIYTRNPNTIILAVTPANTDLANSDSLKLAREVDPEGDRTIGVITKLDLMDEGTSYQEVFEGKVYKLKLGYIGVVGRSQKDLENHKSVQEAVEDEKKFFKNHEIYKKYADRMGIAFLSKELSTTFLRYIKKGLPPIKESLMRIIQEKESEIQQNGDYQYDTSTKESKGFVKTYSEILEGKHAHATTKEVFGGARINYVLNDIFCKAIDVLDPFDSLTDEVIRVAIRNANSLRPSLLLPQIAFENLVSQQILRLQRPVFDALFLVNEELKKVLFVVDLAGTTRFKVLHYELCRIIQEIMAKHLASTREMIKKRIDIELGYIDISHPEFIGSLKALDEVMKNSKEYEEYKNDSVGDLGKLLLDQLKEEKESEPPKNDLKMKEIFLDEVDVDENSKESSVTDKKKSETKSQKEENLEESMNKLDKFQLNGLKTKEKNKSIAKNNTEIEPEKSRKNLETWRFKHNEFISKKYATVSLPNIPSNLRLEEEPTQKEMIEINMIKILVISYFNIIKKNICDSVIKTVMTFLVAKSKNECEKELVTNLYREELFDKLLEEDPQAAENRKQRKENMAYLKRCANILNEIDLKL